MDKLVDKRAWYKIDSIYDKELLERIPEDNGRKSFSLDVENVVQKGLYKGVQQAASVAVDAYCGAKPRFQLIYFAFIRVTRVWRTSEEISGINLQDFKKQRNRRKSEKIY